MVERYYGAQGRLAIRQSLDGVRSSHIWETEEVMEYPLFEPFLEVASAVVVHSHYHHSYVQKKYAGPISVIPLPHYVSEMQSVKRNSRKELGFGDHERCVITVGYANKNKCIDATLKAIASDVRLRKKIRFVVLGVLDSYYHNTLKPLICALNLSAHVTFLGQVSDEQLNHYLLAADMAINLRQPAMEGASASLVESLYLGLPTVVSDTGVYAEFPDNVVIKAPVGAEEASVRQALNILLDAPEAVAAIGQRGADYVRCHLRPQQYAHAFMLFAQQLLESGGLVNDIAVNHVRKLLAGQMVDSHADQVPGLKLNVDSEIKALYGDRSLKAEWN
jgi:glycosyltransferase involved in cell wall biosynthesis